MGVRVLIASYGWSENQAGWSVWGTPDEHTDSFDFLGEKQGNRAPFTELKNEFRTQLTNTPAGTLF